MPFITDSRYALPGEPALIRWAAGGESTWERDTAGQVVRHAAPWAGATTLAYDAGGRLIEQSQSGQTWRYAYDRLDRLVEHSLPNGNVWHYAYNAAGNRTRRQGPAGDDAYAYTPATSRLSSLQRSAAAGRSYTYDAAGLPLGDGRLGFEHDSRGLLSSVTHPNGTARYRHDAAGLRLAKSGGGQGRHFIRAADGRLLAEHDPATGAPMAEYVWLGDWLVGVIRGGVAYRVHADHLGTPRSIANAAGQEQWRWRPDEAFGDNPPEDNVSGTPFDFPLRHAGQYADAESGLFHNGVRSYDPVTGRYLQPDPIGSVRYRNVAGNRLAALVGPGLAGTVDAVEGVEGNQVYSYVDGNPISYTDPNGLQVAQGIRTGARGGAAVGTMIEPGVGTAIGAVIGGAIGAGVGYLICKENAEECKLECTDTLERDEAECLVARAGYGRAAQAICLAKAKDYYASCLRKCDGK